MIFKNIL